MKIIENPALGIGFLLCVGLTVLGFSLLPSAEGQQSQHQFMISTDEQPDVVYHRTPRASAMITTDDYEGVTFHLGPQAPVRSRANIRVQASQSSSSSSQPSNTVRITSTPPVRATRPANDDPFAPPGESRSIQVMRQGFNVVPAEPRPLSADEKRDGLLLRIVQLRLQRGEFEKLPPAVSQMKNPETALEAMLDFAERSDDENVGLLLDMITALTVQMGRPEMRAMAMQPAQLRFEMSTLDPTPARMSVFDSNIGAIHRSMEKLTYTEQIPHAMYLYKATTDRSPETHEEFMKEIIKANNIRLPELKDGHYYEYNPQKAELEVVFPNKD